jgi:hypothetical protein
MTTILITSSMAIADTASMAFPFKIPFHNQLTDAKKNDNKLYK